jgi:magnesium transporter
MTASASAAGHACAAGTHPVARLVSVTGTVEPATTRDVEQRLSAGVFFWLDLECLDDDRLRQFGRSLHLEASSTIASEGAAASSGQAMSPSGAAQRPTMAAVGNSVQALVPAAGGPGPGVDDIAVRIEYTDGFLLTVHSAPCTALEQARHRFDGLRDTGKADGPLVLFLVLDDLVGSFEPQFLALDARLANIQVELVTSSTPGTQAGILAIRRRMAAAVHSLGWYSGDLDAFNAGGVAQLPCMGPGAQPHFDRHRQHVIRMKDAARDYREEAGDALAQFSANISSRQSEVINFLAVVSAIFLPLTFITGYFGMNFDVLTVELKSVWIFILLGNLIPAASVVVTIMLFRRWVNRLGIPKLMPGRKQARRSRAESD